MLWSAAANSAGSCMLYSILFISCNTTVIHNITRIVLYYIIQYHVIICYIMHNVFYYIVRRGRLANRSRVDEHPARKNELFYCCYIMLILLQHTGYVLSLLSLLLLLLLLLVVVVVVVVVVFVTCTSLPSRLLVVFCLFSQTPASAALSVTPHVSSAAGL